MKRPIVLFLALILILTFCSCGSKQSVSSTTHPTETIADTINETKETEVHDRAIDGENIVTGVEADGKIFFVEITLPAYIFDGEDMNNFDADAYAAEMQLTSATVNSDGSVTVSMTKARHRELLEYLASQLDIEFASIVTETSYITGISRNYDFSKITINVISTEYKNAFDFTHLAVGFPAMIYQSFSEMEPHAEIQFLDEKTGEDIFSCVFPDAMNEW